MIEMQNVGKVFRTDTVETHALRNFSLKVEPGEFVAITGHSGSGKTTFLNVAGLLEELDSGRYMFDGQDVSKLTDNERSRIRNRKIGFIFQSFNLIPDINIYRNVEAPLHYQRMPGAERKRRILASLERVGLTSRMKHMPSQLSGGQQQRAAIARAISGEPRLILADEPTGNLDTSMSNQIMKLLLQINAAGTTILMVTHNPELAQQAHRQVHIVDGQIEHDSSLRCCKPVDSAKPADPRRLTETAVFMHDLSLALQSMRRHPVLSALMVLAIAAGIAASMITITVYHGRAGHPIWWKADKLYAVTLDTRDPDTNNAFSRLQRHPEYPPFQVTYQDAKALYRSDIPTRSVMMFRSNRVITPERKSEKPFATATRVTTADFFAMFDVPFLYGTGWSRADDEGPAPVVVLSKYANDKLFLGQNSVGKSITIGDRAVPHHRRASMPGCRNRSSTI